MPSCFIVAWDWYENSSVTYAFSTFLISFVWRRSWSSDVSIDCISKKGVTLWKPWKPYLRAPSSLHLPEHDFEYSRFQKTFQNCIFGLFWKLSNISLLKLFKKNVLPETQNFKLQYSLEVIADLTNFHKFIEKLHIQNFSKLTESQSLLNELYQISKRWNFSHIKCSLSRMQSDVYVFILNMDYY